MYTNGEIVITLTDHVVSVESAKSVVSYYFYSKKETFKKFIKLIEFNSWRNFKVTL